jgi:hypothetical protein
MEAEERGESVLKEMRATTSSSLNSIERAHTSYYLIFGHFFGLLLITSIQQCFSLIGLFFTEEHFPNYFNMSFRNKILILKVIMIFDLVFLLTAFILSFFLRKIQVHRIYLSIFVLSLTAFSLLLNIYELISIFLYISRFDRITPFFGLLLRIILLFIGSIFVIYKIRVSREGEEEANLSFLANINNSDELQTSTQMNLSVGTINGTFFLIILDVLKVECLVTLIIAILFTDFAIEENGSTKILLGDMLSWMDFLIIVLAFIFYVYIQMHKKFLKFAIFCLFTSLVTMVLSYAFIFLDEYYYKNYDYKMCYGFALGGFSLALRSLNLVLTFMHCFRNFIQQTE